jgi:hypothetical protein
VHVNTVVEVETAAVGVSCGTGAELTAADGEVAALGVSTPAGVARLVQAVSTTRTSRAEALMPAGTRMTAFSLLADGKSPTISNLGLVNAGAGHSVNVRTPR